MEYVSLKMDLGIAMKDAGSDYCYFCGPYFQVMSYYCPRILFQRHILG
jgi:hypothetical protein